VLPAIGDLQLEISNLDTQPGKQEERLCLPLGWNEDAESLVLAINSEAVRGEEVGGWLQGIGIECEDE